MNIVLYSSDFEPITILELPMWLLDQLERHGVIRIAVSEPPELDEEEAKRYLIEPKTVTIYCDRLKWRDGSTKTILVTDDEELALILRPTWLPGQTASINGYKAMIRRLTEQLIKLGRQL
jgi:hypothetical protein